MARPQIASHDMILDAANRVLDREGMDAFTLAAVAREVGLTRAAIAFRFTNAQNLKLQALEARVARFAATIAAQDLPNGGTGLLQLARLIGAMAHNPRNLVAYIASSQANMADPDLRALEARRGAILRAAIARAMPPEVPDLAGAVEMFAAHLTGSLIAWSASDEPDGAQFMAHRTRAWLRMTRIAFDEVDMGEVA